MIEYLRGELAELSPAVAVIDCNGVGYLASISLNTYSAIQGKKSCKLYVYANCSCCSSPCRASAETRPA